MRGQRRNVLLLTAIDEHSRGVVVYGIGSGIRKQDVICLMREILARYSMPKSLTVRNDNDSQFEAKLVCDCRNEMKVTQEFAHVGTPDEHCFIEGFLSIVENVICRRYSYDNFQEAEAVINRFMNFYSQKRLHGGLTQRKYTRDN